MRQAVELLDRVREAVAVQTTMERILGDKE
jgi:hypothetical protein